MELCTTLPFSHVSDRKVMAGQSGSVYVTPLLTCVRQEGQLITLLILSVLLKKQEFLRLLLFNSSHLRPFYFSWFDLKNSDSLRKINFLWDKLFLFFLLHSAIFFFCKRIFLGINMMLWLAPDDLTVVSLRTFEWVHHHTLNIHFSVLFYALLVNPQSPN